MLLTIALSLIYVEIKDSVLRRFVSDILRKYLNIWQLRGTVAFSLVLQWCLFFSANYRRRYRGRWLPIHELWVWLAYLSGEWMATVVLSSLLRGDFTARDELVLWTSFILWHLGNPDNITAHTVEDNELWLRRLIFGFFFQVGVAVYVCVKFHAPTSPLNLVAIPIFIAGVLKYGERVWALWWASPNKLRNFLTRKKNTSIVTRVMSRIGRIHDVKKEYLRGSSVVPYQVQFLREAHLSSVIHQPLFTQLPFRVAEEFHEHMVFIKSKSAEEAFRLVGSELHFFNDLLYTKIPLHLSHHICSLGLRSFCFLSAVSSLVAYAVIHHPKHDQRTEYPDMAVTYLLLVGAILLEVHSFYIDALAMAWTGIRLPISLKWLNDWLKSVRDKKRRKKMGQHDLLEYYIKVRGSSSWLAKFMIRFTLGNYLLMFWYSKWHPIDRDLKDFIFDHLTKKRDKCVNEKFNLKFLTKLLDEFKGGEVFKRKCEEKGLPRDRFTDEHDDFEMGTSDFTRIVFRWNIATGLIYYDDLDNNRRGKTGKFFKIGKALSDYMMYLVVARPLMLPLGFSDATNWDTYKEARGFFHDKMSRNLSDARKQFTSGLLQFLPEEPSFYHPKDEENFSQLFKGCLFAKKLRELVQFDRWDHEEKWELISEVWMEMMIYAASYCSWKEHVKELTRGGELLTHVSLLMAHLGLNTQIRKDEKAEPKWPIISNPEQFPIIS